MWEGKHIQDADFVCIGVIGKELRSVYFAAAVRKAGLRVKVNDLGVAGFSAFLDPGHCAGPELVITVQKEEPLAAGNAQGV